MKQKLILDVSHPMAVRSPKSTALQNSPLQDSWIGSSEVLPNKHAGVALTPQW